MTRLWRRREDDARRTKGDPPPTYGQLQTTVDTLTAVVKQQGEIVRNLRSQCDHLAEENTLLRTWLPNAPVVTKPDPELGVRPAESKPDGRELDPDPTRLYVLPDERTQQLLEEYGPKAIWPDAGKDEER